MNENQTQGNTGLLDLGAQTGAQKAGELFVSRALNGVLDGLKNKYGEAQVLMGSAFTRYLNNATIRYNHVRTLATGTTPRSIIGKGNIYVSVGVKHKKNRINTDTVDALLRVSNNILIYGTGGIGKSMMMRYLFLNTAHRGEYVPVLLELRKVSNQPAGSISILDLIYSCMNDFDVQLPREQFEYSLRLGKYLFLMDGFDEVKESQAAETAAAIQAFCSKYPKNPCIITSRPRRDTSPLETFTEVESLPLSKSQAVQLASRIWEEDDKTKEFCHQLENGLYELHQDFAENPLLLSMMFLTFMRNNSIPNHLAEFYSKAYDALYSAHDSNDKGFYRREFRCTSLDETEFKLLLSHFCFQSYFKEDYEFSHKRLLEYLNNSIAKLGFSNVCATDYLEDLRNAVCIIVEDGDIYRFSHRSFQTYFAACYTSNVLTDEQQKKLFAAILSGQELFWTKEDYYGLLSQIEPQRFFVNAFEDKLRAIKYDASMDANPNLFLLRKQYRALAVFEKDRARSGIAFHPGVSDNDYYDFNVISLFRRHVAKMSYNREKCDEWPLLRRYLDKVRVKEDGFLHHTVPLTLIDSSDKLTDEERNSFYEALICVNRVAALQVEIDSWLASLDEKKESLLSVDFLDEL